LASQHACLTLGIDSDQETHLQAHLAGWLQKLWSSSMATISSEFL
jgi:hypothetical protein